MSTIPSGPRAQETPPAIVQLEGRTSATSSLTEWEEEGRRSLSQSSTSSSSSVKKEITIPREVSQALEAKGFAVDSNGTVSWAPDSLTHPRHWSLRRKVYDTAIICFLEFFVTLVSNTGSSIAPLAADQLGLSREWSLFCFTTVYLLGQALGGLIFSPLAESFGGRTIYLTSTFGYSLFCVAIVTWPIVPVVVVSRFMTGLLSAIPCVVAATVVAVIYLFSEAVGTVYVDGFGFTHRQTSLTTLALAVGVVLAFLPRLYDYQVIKLRKRQNRPLEPEDKLFGFLIAAPILAGGLWWFAWTVPPLTGGVSPWVSIASLVLIGFSTQEFDNLLSVYLCDTYATYAASANAPLAFLRAILSGTFTLFGRQVFEKLGSNNALFILAGVATVYCAIAILFGIYGKRVRERSSIAEKTWTASLSNEKLNLSQGSLSSRSTGPC